MTDLPAKPLGIKNYGSIAHLPGSRMGPGDHHCHEGQARIACVKTRDRHDRVIVTEKLDGSNTGVARLDDGSIVALGRAGYLASTSKYEQHQLFAAWVREREDVLRRLLRPGERAVGEWLAQAHGTRYEGLDDWKVWPVFDIMAGPVRTAYDVVRARLEAVGMWSPPIVCEGAVTPEQAMTLLGPAGLYGAVDPVEGAVWRVERAMVYDFMVKWVRPDKVDGSYLPELSGSTTWNWRPRKGEWE